MADSNDRLLDGNSPSRLPGGYQFFSPGDSRVLGWLKEAVAEGDRVNKSDPGFDKIGETMDYVLGQQRRGPKPSYLPDLVVNVTKKAIRTHVAALTDIKPLFQYKTFNDSFKVQSALLNNLVTTWWINTFADIEVGDAVKYALTAGCGDLLIEYDENFGPYGDNRLIARDPRDTLPIRPTRDRSIQGWMGLVIREAQTPNDLIARFPGYQFHGRQTWGELFGRFVRKVSGVIGLGGTLSGLSQDGQAQKPTAYPEEIVYRCFLTDRTINLNRESVLMGHAGSNYAYWVEPGDRLYPQKRLIVATEYQILYDGPSPYWHGGFPMARLKLENWPWLFLGMALTNDLRGLQDAINKVTSDFLQVFQQWVSRTVVADASSVPENEFRRYDPRKPLNKFRVKSSMGDSLKLLDGPQLPPWAFEFYESLYRRHDEMAETANLQQLMQLRQMPGAETIEAYYKALTPGLRLEARMLESFLREVAEMAKVNIFQFYSTKRRILVLGDAGKALSDFDYDPGILVPAMEEGTPGYIAELDKEKPRAERAKLFQKLFTFYVAPNSILALHAQEEQLKYLQLSRQGYMDFWTLLEMLEIPNAGEPPIVMLPALGWDPEAPTSKDPITGAPLPPPMVPRRPITISERLMAMQQLGIGQSVSSAGRKATAQAPPKAANAGDGRETIRESR